ncbi:YceI family protein [Streptomyces sp. NPDC005648]|uniref:YceI family protein n=1 Tax=Streptomyces sp. NPDC005648 TaxID=3157044 RepID=UPI0033A71594
MNLFTRAASTLRRPAPPTAPLAPTTPQHRSQPQHRPGQRQSAPTGLLDPALSSLTGEWIIDPAHSRLGFSVRHALVTTVRGSFLEYDSRLYFDGRDPSRSRAEIVLATGSVDTGVEQRDAHLVGRDFLDARNYPQMRFVSTTVRLVDNDVYRMTGDLTIKNVTRPVDLELTYIGHVTDAFGDERVGFDGTTTINRLEWGLSYNQKLAEGGAMVSEKVRLQFDIAAIRTTDARV